MPSKKEQMLAAIREYVAEAVEQVTAEVEREVRARAADAIRKSFADVFKEAEQIRPEPTTQFKKQRCNVKYCRNGHHAKGYCGTHYVYARKRGWPMPCPRMFEPPQAEKTERKVKRTTLTPEQYQLRVNALRKGREVLAAKRAAAKQGGQGRVRTMEIDA